MRVAPLRDLSKLKQRRKSAMRALRARAVIGLALGTLLCLAWISARLPQANLLLVPQSFAQNILGFTERVSSQANATEPSVAVDRSDGTVYVAWQASGTHVARSDNGGRSFVQTPIVNIFGNDIGDVDVRVGGPSPCATATADCLPGTHRVYVTSLERLPLLLQTHLAYSDD